MSASTASRHGTRPRAGIARLVGVEDPRLILGARARCRAVLQATRRGPRARVPLVGAFVAVVHDVPVDRVEGLRAGFAGLMVCDAEIERGDRAALLSGPPLAPMVRRGADTSRGS